jgi:hypothetical protein
VPAKVPLPEEAIFKRNQAAAERRRAERKEQHKEKVLSMLLGYPYEEG